MNLSKLLILGSFISITLTSCSMFEQRQFLNEMEYQYDEPLFAAHKDFMVVAGDDGRDFRSQRELIARTPAMQRDSEDLQYQSSLSRELLSLENKLPDGEYHSYLQYRSKLGNTSQKIYFLRLSLPERISYLKSRGLFEQHTNQNLSAYSPRSNDFYQSAVRAPAARDYMPNINDIVLGMTKDDVLQNWGQPERRDVAGDPSRQNERWAYRRAGSIKYIYFEAGRVEGWSEQ